MVCFWCTWLFLNHDCYYLIVLFNHVLRHDINHALKSLIRGGSNKFVINFSIKHQRLQRQDFPISLGRLLTYFVYSRLNRRAMVDLDVFRGQCGKHWGFPITSIAMSHDCENDVKMIILLFQLYFQIYWVSRSLNTRTEGEGAPRNLHTCAKFKNTSCV